MPMYRAWSRATVSASVDVEAADEDEARDRAAEVTGYPDLCACCAASMVLGDWEPEDPPNDIQPVDEPEARTVTEPEDYDLHYALEESAHDCRSAQPASVEVPSIVTADVKTVHAIDKNSNDVGTELDMVALLELNDGRWASLEAGNDYTGWGCMGDFAAVRIGSTREAVIRYGLTKESRARLRLALPEDGAL
jgi:hypothetical protein